MTEKIRRVDRDGPPDPEQHPWVMVKRFNSDRWVLFGPPSLGTSRFMFDNDWWYPTDPPPTEYVEDEGVEVDGRRWRLSDNGSGVFIDDMAEDGGWHFMGSVDMLKNRARVAAALGLVDQPTVPKKLVDWLEQRANESGGSPAGSVYDDGYQHTAIEALDAIRAGEFGPVEWEWVTDRLPTESEYPVLVNQESSNLWGVDETLKSIGRLQQVDLAAGWRWVSLSSLLGDR